MVSHSLHSYLCTYHPWQIPGAGDVEINMEPSESEDSDQNQHEDLELDDDGLSLISKSSRSSVVSNAPSVQHFNISVHHNWPLIFPRPGLLNFLD